MKHASLFTGIGVFDLASEEAGLENIFQVENDDWCCLVLNKRFPKIKKYKDVREFNGKPYRGSINIISGGFPCQDISISGRGEGIFGSRSSLWSEYCRVISEIHPAFVIIENSPQLLRKGFEKVLHDLQQIGYDAEWETFFASEFGKYHHRERLYVLAYPNAQRWRGLLHYIKRNISEKNKEADPLDASCNPFLQFEQRCGEPGAFRVVDGLAKKLDVIKRLGGCGNAVVKDIPLEIFRTIKQVENCL